MASGHDTKQVSEGFRDVENGILDSDDLDRELGNSPNSEGISAVQPPQLEDETNRLVGFDALSNNGPDGSVINSDILDDISSLILAMGNQEQGSQRIDDIFVGSNTSMVIESVSKDDMFVDAPDDFNVYDGKKVHSREVLASTGYQNGLDRNTPHSQKSSFSDNEMQGRGLIDEAEGFRGVLGNDVDERGVLAEVSKEERETFMEEITSLHEQLKVLSDHPSYPVEGYGGLLDQLHRTEIRVGVEKTEKSNTPWHNLVNECRESIEKAVDERTQSEGTIRELNAILFMKEEEIENLNAKISELSVSHDVFSSYFDSTHETWSLFLNESSKAKFKHDHDINIVTDRMLASLSITLNQEEPLSESITDKIYYLDKLTSALIERHNQFVWELSDLRRKELDSLEKLSCMEAENKRLVEQLIKGDEARDMANAELGKIKIELQQEKNRCGNVKEKLTLAVTKENALVQNWDSLKQTLADKTSEYEKCMFELQEKSSALEAAELSKVELNMCDNIIASLQKTLMQRDAVVENFIETLSQIAMPEEFQSADIVSKLNWLVEDRNVLNGVALEFQKVQSALTSFNMFENVSSFNSNMGSQVRWLGETYCRTRDALTRLIYDNDQMREAACDNIDCLSAALSAQTQNNVFLQNELEELGREYNVIVEKEHRVSLEKDQIVKMLTEALGSKMEDLGIVYWSISDIPMLIERCFQKIMEHGIASSEISRIDAESFERIQSLLYVRNIELSMCEQMLDERMLDRLEAIRLSGELQVTSRELLALKDEKSLLLNDFVKSQEKSVLLRDKLSMAVKKGKELVQERGNLKGVLVEKKIELEQLRFDLAEKNNMLQMVIESIDKDVLPVDSNFKEPIEKMEWLCGYLRECQLEKVHVEEKLGRVEGEVSDLNSILIESKRNIKLLGDALSVSEDNASQLAEENKELEVSKAYIEQELQRVIEEVNSSTEQELGRLKEEINILECKLAEANKTINSLEISFSASENKVSQLEDKKREIQISKRDVEQMLQKTVVETHSMSSKLSELCVTVKSLDDALSLSKNNMFALSNEKEKALAGKVAAEVTIRSLEDALLKAESSVSQLVGEKNAAKQEILILSSKLNVCMENLAGIHGRSESRFEEFFDHLNNLQMLLIDDTMLSSLRIGFEKKIKCLKDMDDLLKHTRYYLVDNDSVLQHNLDVTEVESSWEKLLSNDPENILNGKIDDSDGDDISSIFSKTIAALHLRNETLVGKFDGFSTFMDDLISSLMRELLGIRNQAIVTHNLMESLKKDAKNMEINKQAQENICRSSKCIIEELQEKLIEARKAFEMSLEESVHSQHRVSELESDVESLQSSCIDMKHKLDDYGVKEIKMKEREADILSSYDHMLKQNEAKDDLLSAAQLEMLFEEINKIQFGDLELQNSAPAKKLFYTIGSVPELFHQISLLSHDKELLKSNLSKQVDEMKQLKEIVETNTRDEQVLEKLENEILHITLGLENLILKIGGSSDSVGGKGISVHTGELLVILEKLVMDAILESESKLSKSQKLVDDLSIKVKVFEDSIQGKVASMETVQERSIYVAPSIPSGSEISEVEDAGCSSKRAIPAPAPSATHVRTMHKGSSDHIAIDIDLESNRLIRSDGTDEDKGRDFKSLNTTGLIPKQGKLLADQIDGIWVSCNGVLRRRPRARLGVVAYIIILHIWFLGILL